MTFQEMQDKRGYIVIFSLNPRPIGDVIAQCLAGDNPIETPVVVIGQTDENDLRGQYAASGIPYSSPPMAYQFFHRVIAE